MSDACDCLYSTAERLEDERLDAMTSAERIAYLEQKLAKEEAEAAKRARASDDRYLWNLKWGAIFTVSFFVVTWIAYLLAPA